MSNSVSGGQLNTYNPFLPITTSTTAGTQNLIVYPVSAEGAQGGITNAASNTSNTAATNIYYDGITHFKNVSGINSLSIGPSGSEIPLHDKQEALVASLSNSSAATVVWCVTPYQCTMSGYVTNAGSGATPAGVTNVLVYAGSSASGGLIATITVTTGGGPGDTYSWTCATPSTVIAGGQPLSFNFNTTASGTAYSQVITAVLTRVGI